MLESCELIDRGVLIGSHLIISDLHIGYQSKIDSFTEEEEKQEILNRLEQILEEHDIDTVVLNGDIFHEFSSPSRESRRLLRQVRGKIKSFDAEPIFISGNHDTPALDTFNHLPDFQEIYTFTHDDLSVAATHGDKDVKHSADLCVVGHIHPVVKINGSSWPAYLYGPGQQSDILILPAFNTYQDGIVMSSRPVIDVDFPLVSLDSFPSFKPIVYDSNEGATREFPEFSESDRFFGL